MSRIGAISAAIGLIVVTLVVLPAQMIAHRCKWPFARRLPVWWHRFALARLGFRVTEIGAPAADRPLLLVPNHASWLDIPLLGSRMPLSFVAKSEVARWPIFGLLARLQRCVFVERERRTKTGDVARDIGARLADGDVMVLFAEGTSNDGNGVLPFRSALLGAATAAMTASRPDGATHATVWVQPVAIRYTRIHGLPVGRADRPKLAWYGDMDLLPHLKAVFALRAVDVEIVWGEPIAAVPGMDRKRLAYDLEVQVRALLHGQGLGS
jgi:1-acyl-sn-glycerol-3-phosphate acyltransferase